MLEDNDKNEPRHEQTASSNAINHTALIFANHVVAV
jgi:hypothetical protein